MKKLLLSTLLLTSNVLITKANLITVPTDYSTIQQAIDASLDGDTVAVLQGTYYENINLHGKRILLTSLFYLGKDTSYISSTIINGSQPTQPDTGTCVLMNSGEDSTTILQGFTITGGTGTKWLDEHGAGTYREGGGILIQYSSPIIRHNAIIYNYATNTTGVSGAGGGGLRIGDSNPQLLNNIIANNQARYGPGIVLNYTGCIIKNNLICFNSGGQTFNGGGAVWASGDPLTPTDKLFENNTIYANHATIGTGGILSWGTAVIVRNNIIRNNTSPNNSQVYAIGGGTASVTYSDIQGGYAGSGNIDTDPLFTDTASFYLVPLSPCIDAGDSSVIYNDIENTSLPGFALLPSLGTIRNDIGAYGGQGAFVFGQGQPTGIIVLSTQHSNGIIISPNPAGETFQVSCSGIKLQRIELMNATGEKVLEKNNSKNEGSIIVNAERLKRGIYIVKIFSSEEVLTKKMVLK
ncbi:MAG TPA: T9SS type A sorting domain-containing protein [Bacteroidia bacterium]|nr:T9SS type A sorting domain-containing protein [Bacteroidia bacterium]